MHVIATAGHVDHGKSTLVRALTGQDPDRLDEERRRGLTIELGHCSTRLPRAGDVAFVLALQGCCAPIQCCKVTCSGQTAEQLARGFEHA